MNKNIFDKCIYCGCIVYKGFGDDVIPTGYLTEEGYVCENCKGYKEQSKL